MKMRFKYIVSILPILASCTAEPLQTSDLIALEGRIAGSYETKAAVSANAYTATTPSESNPLAADIWFSATSGTYANTGGLNSHRTITYLGPSVTNPSPDSQGKYLRYPTDGTTVYCVGLYPQGDWSTTDNKNATATIDGKADLMFAAQKTGTANSPFNSSPQIFDHELTWVKIRVRSESHETGETWGNIQSISIASASKASVKLETGEATYSGSSTIVAFEGDKEMPIMSTEFGSVLVSPAVANGSGTKYYSVSIKCKNHEKNGVEVLLTDNSGTKFTGDTKGKVFVLTLFFKTLTSIDFSATLSDWEDESRTLDLS